MRKISSTNIPSSAERCWHYSKLSDPTESKVLLLDDDMPYCRQLSRLGQKRGIAFLSCFNFSDFWSALARERKLLLAIVVEYDFLDQMTQSSRFHSIGRIPVFVVSHKARSSAFIAKLPHCKPKFIHKKYGISAVTDAIIALYDADRADRGTSPERNAAGVL